MRLLYAFIVVFAILVVYEWTSNTHENYLYGYWVAEGDEFCESAQIDSMQLFIGEPVGFGLGKRSRNCYLVIMNNFCNQGVTITYRRGWNPIAGGKYKISADIKFDEQNVWEDCVDLDIDINNGTLLIYRGETLYGKLYKQHDITNRCRENEDTEITD